MFGSDTSTSDVGVRPSVLNAYPTASNARVPASSRGSDRELLSLNASAGGQVGSNNSTSSTLPRRSEFDIPLVSDQSNSQSDSQPAFVTTASSFGESSANPKQIYDEQSQKMADRNDRFQKSLQEMDLALKAKDAVRPPTPREFQNWLGAASVASLVPDLPGISLAPANNISADQDTSSDSPNARRKLDVLV